MKKFIVFVIMSAFFLCGCMQTEEIDFADMSGSLTVASERELSQKDIEGDDSYVIGISEKTYSGCVERAAIFSPDFSSDGFEMTVIKTKNAKDAAIICAEMESGYEAPPCDPAENIRFVYDGCYVIRVKGKASDADRICDEFKVRMHG
ncbi:unknown [Eubacterium sp. CAG:841]|nr:unknown [Eubacterium sp. CAG:841]